TDQQEQPALNVEQLVLIAHDAAVAAEQIEALLQALGQLHVAAVAPEIAFALRPVVVDDQEVADALVLEGELPVVTIDVGLPETAVREELPQERDAALDQVDARGFERLEKPRGQADRDAVPVPAQPPASGRESQLQWIAQRAALEARHQLVLRLIVL